MATKKTTKKAAPVGTSKASQVLQGVIKSLTDGAAECDRLGLTKSSRIITAAAARLAKVDIDGELAQVNTKVMRETKKAERAEAAEAKKADRAKKLIAQLAKLGVQVKR
jgi:hypothetical protein